MMPVTLSTNINVLQSQKHLNQSAENVDRSLVRLASGSQIASAKDNASGLQIANRMLVQGSGLDRAAQNANDAISMIETVDSALNDYTDNIMRMRDLSLEYGNGAFSKEDKESIRGEYDSLQSELARITNSTSFGGKRLLSNHSGKYAFQIGSNSAQVMQVIFPDLNEIHSKKAQHDNLEYAIPELTDSESVDEALKQIDHILDYLGHERIKLGTAQNRLGHSLNSIYKSAENVAASQSQIRDTDFAKETTELTKQSIIKQANTSMFVQANRAPNDAIRLLG